MSRSKDKPIRFEEAIEELESIIEQVESGQVGLEESLARYERGMKLVSQCRAILETAEKRIAELSMDNRGRLKAGDEVDAEPDDEHGETAGGEGDDDDTAPF